MCRCCFFFLRLPSNSAKQFFFLSFFFDGASQIQGDSGRELELRGKKEKPFREIPFSFYVSIDLFLRFCLVSHFLRIWFDADRSLAGKRSYQEESPEHLKYPRMLLPNPLSQNTSGRGNDVRARDPIGEILLVQNHQRNLISSFLPSVFLQIRPFCQAQHWDRWFKKEKNSVKLVSRTLIGRLWANAWNGRAEKRKERISLSTTAASTTYCKPVHLCLSLSPTRKTRFKMSVRPFSLNMIYIRAASGSLSEKEKRGCIDWSTTSRPSLVRLLLLPILLLFLSLHSLSIDEL